MLEPRHIIRKEVVGARREKSALKETIYTTLV